MRKRKGPGPREAAMTPEECKGIRLSLKLVGEGEQVLALAKEGEKGLTQEQFAAALGVQWLAINQWEQGKTPISRSRALAIQALVLRASARGAA